MKKLATVFGLALLVVGCSSSDGGGDGGDCDAARAAYQERVAFVYPEDSFKLSAEYKAMTKAEQQAYDEGTADALDAMNLACKTGPYAE